jgi:hypothetical protein
MEGWRTVLEDMYPATAKLLEGMHHDTLNFATHGCLLRSMTRKPLERL